MWHPNPYVTSSNPFEPCVLIINEGCNSGLKVGERKWPVKPESKAESDDVKEKDVVMCFYCKKQGHIVANCPVLKKHNVKPVA